MPDPHPPGTGVVLGVAMVVPVGIVPMVPAVEFVVAAEVVVDAMAVVLVAAMLVATGRPTRCRRRRDGARSAPAFARKVAAAALTAARVTARLLR
jgi:hypothetical protein